jgi:hypothetical protein
MVGKKRGMDDRKRSHPHHLSITWTAVADLFVFRLYVSFLFAAPRRLSLIC